MHFEATHDDKRVYVAHKEEQILPDYINDTLSSPGAAIVVLVPEPLHAWD